MVPIAPARRLVLLAALVLLALVPVAPACRPAVAPRVAPQAEGWTLQAEVARGRLGMVASAEPHATEVGVDVLLRGGNAVDAAVAVGFALAVTYPYAGNVGGGGFLVLRHADGSAAALDFRETAPAAATRDMYLDADGELTDLSLYGPLAAGTPGSVRGLYDAHQRYGSLPWSELVRPAIRLAGGFPVSAALHDSLASLHARIEGLGPERADLFAGTLDTLMPGGKVPATGSTLRLPDLARTLERVAAQGPDGFYSGVTADLIVAEMQRGGGIVTHDDLRKYRTVWREPIRFDYRGHQVLSMPPSSSGGATLAEIANILEGYDLAALPFASPRRLHLLAEAMKRGFADRNTYLGDPDFVSMPLQEMISDDYARRRRAEIRAEVATPADRVGPALGAAAGGDTTHYSIVDRHGTAVSVTTTINSGYGSLTTVRGAGFLLNNEMDDFAAKPGSPNVYGLIQGEANAIAGGKRMLSSMTPSIVADPRGRLLLVTGSPGGSRIITIVLQTILNAIDHEMDAAGLVAAPRVHHQHLPDRLRVERDGFPASTLDALRRMGHDVELVDPDWGNAQAILVLPDGTLTGAADPRGSGLARGY